MVSAATNLQLQHTSGAEPPVVPQHLAWLLRQDLRAGESASDTPPEWFELWWRLEGFRHYPAWAELNTSARQGLLKPLPDQPHWGLFGMTPALRYLLQRRPDVRKAFDVRTQPGLWRAIAWLYTYGLRETGLLDIVDAETIAALDQTPPFLAEISDPTQPMLTWQMYFAWLCAPKLQERFDLRRPQDRASYLLWFFFDGVPRLGLDSLMAERWRLWLLSPVNRGPQVPGLPPVQMPLAIWLLWQAQPGLRQTYDVSQPAGWAALAGWGQRALRQESALNWLLRLQVHLQPQPVAPKALATPFKQRPFGVNLIGFAYGELGIGEDVRMAVAACEAAGIPFKVVNINPGSQLRQQDRSLEVHLQNQVGETEAPYAINVFCLTGYDTCRVYLERGAALFADRYNIGWWPWELPVWPKRWQVAFDLMDEIWAATRYTETMYRQAQQGRARQVPVVHMPMAVSVDRLKSMTRAELGLPEKRFLFLYVFDFNSYLARKNPWAALQAFQRAFKPQDQSVGLVFKTMNSRPNNPEWKRFMRECAKDPRITVLDRTMDRGEVLGLIQTCDAYVSLHRAEGFGRTLAEAMLLGKPVIATNFSGNTDFLTEETGYPVNWTRRPVGEGEYPFVAAEDEAWWAEPDLEHAAEKMNTAKNTNHWFAFSDLLIRDLRIIFEPLNAGRTVIKNLSKVREY